MVRLLGFALLWWVLTSGDAGSWLIGVPAVLLATWFSVSLSATDSVRISPAGLARYLLFFMIESIKGGMDVARRALLPGTQVHPHFLQYRTHLAAGFAREMLVYTVSLLPGTITVDIQDDLLTVHALSLDMKPLDNVKTCEKRVAEVFNADPPKDEF